MYLLFDIGGSKMRLAVTEDRQNFSEPEVFNTPKTSEEGVEKIKEFAAGKEIKAIIGGVAGPFNKERTEVVNAPNLPSWNNKPLKAELQKIAPDVYLENDTALAGLGEAVYGAGKEKNIVVYITVSTGFGGTRIVNKKIDESAMGFEPGWQIIDADGTLCGKDGYCYLEDYVSGTGIMKRYGKEAEDITDKDFWNDVTRIIALGLNNVIVHWSPDVIAIGGSIGNNPEKIHFDVLQTELRKAMIRFPEPPEIKRAALGDKSGLYGALALLNQKESSSGYFS